MAKHTILKERGTAETLYPQTLAEFVQMADGGNVENGVRQAKFALFVDMWNNAAGSYGRYNPDTGMFELNGLTDITYEQALDIYRYTAGVIYGGQQNIDHIHFEGLSIRTNLPFHVYGAGDIMAMFCRCSKLEVVAFQSTMIYARTAYSAFSECGKLRSINCVINIGSNNVSAFSKCYSLVDVRVLCAYSFSLSDSPLVSLDSMTYMVTKSSNTNQITITVHPTVWAKLFGDMENETVAAMDAEELAQWMALPGKAQARKIVFATV